MATHLRGRFAPVSLFDIIVCTRKRCLKGEKIMAQIEWITSYANALTRAGNEKRLVFLDIFNPG
jgi:hypothetical protein